MSIEFYESLKWATAAFAAGVFLREYSPSEFGKWLGRSGVLVSLFSMSAFGAHATRECSTLIQLVGSENVREIASVAVVTGYEIKTPNGAVISWGGAGTVPIAIGRIRRSSNQGGTSDRPGASESYATDDVPHATATQTYDEGGRDF